MLNFKRILRNRKIVIPAALLVVVGVAVALYFLLRKRRDGFQNVKYRMRVPITDASGKITGWRCPKGWRDAGGDWDLPGGEKQCSYLSFRPLGSNGKCIDGYVPTGSSNPAKACRHAHRGEKEAKDFKQHTLKKDGSDCTRDNQCDSMVCWEYKCQPRNIYGDGAYCRNNRFCKSKNCVNSKCEPAGGSPAPAPAPADPANTEITTDVIG